MNKEELREKLLGTAVLCKSEYEYVGVMTLYLLAGAKRWPWHKGYKDPSVDGDSHCGYYGWEHAGFMKHIHPVPVEKQITLNDLFNVLNPPSLGELIVIEGIDGTGKTTTAKALVKSLCDSGKKAVYVKFPFYGSDTGKTIVRYLNNEFGEASKVDPYLSASLYSLDRLAHKNYLEDLLENNDYVILDRYFYSNIALQGSKDGTSYEAMRDFIIDNEVIKGGLPVGKTFLLDFNDDVTTSERIGNRSAEVSGTGLASDGHESDEAFMNKATEIYKTMAKELDFIEIELFLEGKRKDINTVVNDIKEKI